MIKKILVVDDEPDIVKVIGMRLKASNFEVATASDGEEALNKISEDKPDLIIADYMMPKINGLQLCRMIKSAEEYKDYKDIPIIMLTARTQIKDISEIMEAGATTYMHKPFKAEALLGIINSLHPGE